jgi:hypothetical protein
MMSRTEIPLRQLVRELDSLFAIQDWDDDPAMSRFLPRAYKAMGHEWAAGNRAACQAYAESTGMALLGFSHAATEFLVMKTQMADYFRERGLEVSCLEQADCGR